MKRLFPIVFLVAGLIGHGQRIDATQFFPLKVGNYWVYEDLYHTSKPDTVRITETKMEHGYTAYNSGKWLYAAVGDSIYDFQSERSGYRFPVKQFFPSDTLKQYSVFIGGDVISSKTVSKIEGAYQCGAKKYFNCYQFEGNNERVVIARGVGIIERKTSKHFFCLVDYKLE